MAALNDLNSTGGTTNQGSSTRLTFADRLKDNFVPAMRDFYADYKNQILGEIASNTGDRLEGNKNVTVAGTTMIVSAGARGQAQRLPTATASSSVRLEITSKKYEASLEMQPELEADARGGATSWEQAYAYELKSLMTFMEIDKNDIAQVGRAHPLWRYTGAISGVTGVGAIASITNRGSTATTYFDRGLLDRRAGTNSAFPAFRNRRISHVPNGANGVFGAPTTGVTWPSGDRQTANDNVATDEIYVGGMDGTPTAPTITHHSNGAIDTGLGAFSSGWAIPYASRAPSGYGTAADDITRHYSFEGLLSFLSRYDIGYAAVLGAAKSSAAGLQAFYDAGSSGDRPFSDGLMNVIMRQVMAIRDDGHLPTKTLCTWAGWERVSAQYDTYKRMDPVIGNGGTTAVGNKPENFMLHAGAGSVMFKPCVLAMPKMMQIISPADWEKLPNIDFKLLEPQGNIRVPEYDGQRWDFIERFNIWCKDPQGQAVIDDLSEDPFTALT